MTVQTESGKIFQKRGLAVMDPFAPAGELFLSENPERCVFIPVISKYSRGKYRPGNSNVRNILVFPFAVEKCDGKMKFGIVAKSECGGQGQYVFCLLPTNRCRWKSVCGMTPQLLRYSRRIRMETVCRYLHYSDKTIDEIAVLTGFSGHYYFSRVFRQLQH